MEQPNFKGHHLTISTFCTGENFWVQSEIDPKKLEQAFELLGVDKYIDLDTDISPEHAIRIAMITPEQHRESLIIGEFTNGIHNRKLAEMIVDGVEISSEEFDRLNDLEEGDPDFKEF